MYEKYNWRFDEEVTKVFDSHVNMSVPLYQAFHNNISNMSVYFTQERTNVVDIGTSTGTLLYDIQELNHNKRGLNFIGLDIEEAMIKECLSRYSDIDSMKFKLTNALDFDYTNSSVITSMLALQFMTKKDRKILLKKLYQGLNEDGALFIVEKTKTSILDLHDIYNDLYYDFKRENLVDTEILDKNQSLRGVMKPLSVDDNISMIKEVGFSKIDIFTKYLNFTGFIAIK